MTLFLEGNFEISTQVHSRFMYGAPHFKTAYSKFLCDFIFDCTQFKIFCQS